MPREAILAFALALLIALLLTPIAIRLATRFRLLDVPGGLKTHAFPVPAVGGLVIYASLAITSGIAVLFNERIRSSLNENSRFWIAIGIAGTIVFLVGLYDDIRHASIWMRFSFQTVAALITTFLGGVVIGTVGIPLDGLKSTGWFAVPLTVIWIVGVTNAFNLIDGVDGLAGGIGFISTAAVFAICIITSRNFMVMLATAALCGALLGFLRYNKPPARIFLGDCGSMLLGYSLSVLAILGRTKKATSLAILIPILVVGVPVLDTISSMVRRLSRKLVVEKRFKFSYLLSMFSGDREHIHHMLLGRGHTERLSVVILYSLSLSMAAFALMATIANEERVGFVLMLFAVGAFFVIRRGWFGLLRKNGRDKNASN